MMIPAMHISHRRGRASVQQPKGESKWNYGGACGYRRRAKAAGEGINESRRPLESREQNPKQATYSHAFDRRGEGSQGRVSDAPSQGVRPCGKEVAGIVPD
jgi:hypothetical protein